MSAPALAMPEPRAAMAPIFRAIGRAFAQPPVLSVSQWAEARLHLPPRTTSRPGPFRFDLVPYARDILDALSPSSPWRLVVWETSAQVAKTTIGLVWATYVIDQNPGPFLHVQPTQNNARRLAKTKLEPMIEATACLREKIKPARSRDSGNTRLAKEFPNGIFWMAGANSPAELAGMSARDTHLDEVERFPREGGDEGDPVEIVGAR